DAEIGVPALVGRHAFLRWQGRHVTVFALQTGGEVARSALPHEGSHVFLLGGAVFFGGGRAAQRRHEPIGLCALGRASAASLRPRGLPGTSVWMTPGTEVLAPTASAGDKARLHARPRTSGRPGFDTNRFVATYHQAAVGFNARSGAAA